MKISTKVEFGLIAIIDIASNCKNGCAVTTPEIAGRQNISRKYLEQILSLLSGAGLVRGQKGSNGGYVTARDPSQITAGDIINALDANMLRNTYYCAADDNGAMVHLIDKKLWSKMSSDLHTVAEKITLEELCEEYERSQNVPMYYI